MSVQDGSVEQDLSTPDTLNLHVYSERAILDFSSFDIASHELVRIYHHFLAGNPGLLSRVFNGLSSQIAGRLLSNGQFILINPAGILISGTADIQAMGGFIASTLNITNEDFLNDRLFFSQVEGYDPGVVVNRGRILTGPGEILALLGGAARNEGLLVAGLGTVALASGKQMTLSFDREGWLAISVDQPLDRVAVGLDGRPVKDAVYQSGLISGSHVLVKASALEGLFDRLVALPEGVIEAVGVVHRGGRVELVGEGGVVYQGGRVAANAIEGGVAGEIRVEGEDVTLASSSRLEAKAEGEQGTGGSVTVTSSRPKESGRLDFQAGSVIDVSGGSVSGDAGSIELSASTVEFGGRAVGTAQEGSRGGRLFVDPLNLIFTASGNPPTPADNSSGTPDIAAGDAPAAGTTTIKISDITGFAEAFFQAVQDITVNNSLIMGNNNDLRFEAGRNINLNGNTIRVKQDGGDLTLIADADFSGSGGAASDGVGTINQAAANTIQADNGTITLKTGGDFTARNIQGGSGGTIQITSTHGKILDDGNAATNISGGSLLLEAATGIGASGTALATDVSTLAARVTGAGGVFISENNAVSLGTVAGVSGVETANGSVTITSGNTMTVNNGSVVANGAGSDLFLTATAGDLRVGRVQAANNITLTAAAGKIEEFGADAAADITGNQLTLNAALGVGTLGAIETDINTLILNVASGGVTLADQGSFTLNTPVALGNGVSLDLSAANDLRTADNSTIAVTGAGTVKLEAGKGGAGELVVKRDLTTDTGEITLMSSGRMDLWRVASNSGNIMATSGTDLIIRDAVNTAGAGSINGQAADSVDLRAAAKIRVTGTGTVDLSSGTDGTGQFLTGADALIESGSGKITLNGMGGDMALQQVKSASGNIEIQAGKGLTFNNLVVTGNGGTFLAEAKDGVTYGAAGITRVNGGGTLTVRSGTDGTGSLFMNDGSQVQSGSGKVLLESGTGMTLDQVRSTSGDVELNAGSSLTINDLVVTGLGGTLLATAKDAVTFGAAGFARVNDGGTLTVRSGTDGSGALLMNAGSQAKSGSGKLLLESGSDMTLTTVNSDSGNVEVNSGDSMTLNGVVSADNGGTLMATAQRGIAFNAAGQAKVSGTGTLDVTAGASGNGGMTMDAAASVTSGSGKITLGSAGDMTLTSVSSNSGNVEINSNNGLTLNGTVATDNGGTLLATAKDGVTIGAIGLAKVSGTGTLTVRSGTDGTGSLLMNDGGQVISGGGKVFLESAENMTLDQVRSTSGDIELNAGKSLAFNDLVVTGQGGTLLGTAKDAVTFGAAGFARVNDAGTLTVRSGTDGTGIFTMNAGSQVQSGSGKVTLASADAMTLQRVSSASGDIEIDSDGSLSLQDTLVTGGAGTVLATADHSVTVGALGVLQTNGTGGVTLISGSDGSGILTMNAGSELATNTGDITVRSAGSAVLRRTTSAGGEIEITAGDDLSLMETVSTGGGAGITATSAGPLRVRLAETPGGAVKLTSTAGAIERFGPAGSVNVRGASGELTAASGIGTGANGPLETAVDELTAAVTGPGDILVTETDALLLAATTANGSISVTAGGPITVSNASVTANGAGSDLTLITTSGDLILGNVAADDFVTLTAAGSILENGDDPDADVTGTDGLLTAGGTIGLPENPLEVSFSNAFTAVNAPGGFHVNDLNAPPPAPSGAGLGGPSALPPGLLLSPSGQSSLLSQILSFLSEEEARRRRSRIG